MELGCDGVLVNSAPQMQITPILMAKENVIVTSGRNGLFKAGRMKKIISHLPAHQ